MRIINKFKPSILFFLVILALASCVSGNTNPYLSYSRSGLIDSYDSKQIRHRHLDTLNALRIENGLNTLVYSKELNASAKTHARDIAHQKRAWNFGSDYSSPVSRASRAGFNGVVLGENVSETFEGEFEVLQVWINNPISRSILFDPKATHIGFGWYQEVEGTIWWVQDIAELAY